MMMEAAGMMSLFSKLLVERTNDFTTQFLRYVVVGGLAFLVDFALLLCSPSKSA